MADVRCSKCGFEGCEQTDLVKMCLLKDSDTLVEPDSGLVLGVLNDDYFLVDCCPTCRTDKHLMDIQT